MTECDQNLIGGYGWLWVLAACLVGSCGSLNLQVCSRQQHGLWDRACDSSVTEHEDRILKRVKFYLTTVK